MGEEILNVLGLKKYFPVAGGKFPGFLRPQRNIHAVDNIDFTIQQSETFGLVGESGCGKSTTGLMMVRLLEPTEGKILFRGKDIAKLNGRALLEMRKNIQIVFQNPYASLDPRWTVEKILMEPLRTHRIFPKHQLQDEVVALLEAVGLNAAYMHRYPHQFSGGQRQRIGIVRALAVKPMVLVADEPVSALDVSVQAQILNIIQDLRDKLNLSILFISHDLNIVKYLSHRVGVMYMGKLVEVGPVDDLFENPIHPYTQALLSAIPEAAKNKKRTRIILEGETPSPIDPVPLCRFRTRCPKFHSKCSESDPPRVQIGEDHSVLCHLAKID